MQRRKKGIFAREGKIFHKKSTYIAKKGTRKRSEGINKYRKAQKEKGTPIYWKKVGGL